LADRSSTAGSPEIYPAPAFTSYGKKFLKNDFNGEEGFTLDGGIKDAACVCLALLTHGIVRADLPRSLNPQTHPPPRRGAQRPPADDRSSVASQSFLTHRFANSRNAFTSAVAHQHLVSARAAGGSDLDWSSLVGGVRIASGLPAFKDKKSRLERYE
jgi:hypothetical protein